MKCNIWLYFQKYLVIQSHQILYSKSHNADYRNLIKESTSTVEIMSRNIVKENVLSFIKMKEKGIAILNVLRKVFEYLYGYTNNKTTGISHALMDETNVSQAEEALFMPISCITFTRWRN